MSDSAVPYQSLNPEKIVKTLDVLAKRVEERFPTSGLARVCVELLGVAEKAKDQAAWIGQPIIFLRVGIALLILLIIVGAVGLVLSLSVSTEAVGFVDFVQAVEAGINDIVLIGVGIFFLTTIEHRIKRRRALKAIHELRSIAHIIDMHQLTKDPDHNVRQPVDTPSSPRRTLTTPQLIRYLDYCSEMLSMTGKIAALYVQDFDDNVALASVNEVEGLTTGLSNKIWQKLIILEGALANASSAQ